MKILAEGLQFPEGPVVLGDGSVVLVEMRAGRIVRVAPDGQTHTVSDCGGGPNGAAIGPATAAEVASWADGLITTAQAPQQMAEVLDAYRSAGGRGPIAVQAHFSWAPDERQALDIAHDQWRHGVVTPPDLWDIETPEEFDRRSASATPEDIAQRIFVSADPEAHLEHLLELAGSGIDELYLHNVAPDHEEYLTVFGRQVLPALKEA